MNRTLDSIRRFAWQTPAAVALSGPHRTITYRQLFRQITLWGHVLRDSGIRVLGIRADNSPDWACLDLAAQSVNVVVVPLPKFFSPSQTHHALIDSGADALITDESGSEDLVQAPLTAIDFPETSLRLWRRTDRQTAVPLPEGTAKISYTSGTTGQPKGVCIPETSMNAVAGSLVEATEELELRKHLCLLPLATLLENIAGVYAPLIAGHEVSLPGLGEIGWSGAVGLDPASLCGMLWQAAPNSIILVPEMLRILVGAAASGWKLPESLRFAAVGGGRVSTELLEKAAEFGLPVYEGYGLTECASVVALNTPGAHRPGSVGRPLRHAGVRVDSSGEILVTGARMCGYIGASGSKNQAHSTGDLGHLDEDGYLYIRGRRKNVFINSFGRNVSPDWVEPEFLRSGLIRQIAIFGEARPYNVAVVVPGQTATGADIQTEIDNANTGLPDYMRVRHWMVAREPFSPDNGLLTANGRTRRPEVWNAYLDQIQEYYDDRIGRSA